TRLPSGEKLGRAAKSCSGQPSADKTVGGSCVMSISTLHGKSPCTVRLKRERSMELVRANSPSGESPAQPRFGSPWPKSISSPSKSFHQLFLSLGPPCTSRLLPCAETV